MSGGLLEDKVLVVTGAAAGIGRAVALAAAEAGARLVLGDIDEEGGEETAGLVTAAGGEALFCSCDVSRDGEVGRLLTAGLDRHSRIDAACNNAGIEGSLCPTAEYPGEVFERVVAVNLVGVWKAMQAEIPALLATGGGAIVNMSSVGGVVGAAGMAPYVATKHAVLGLTRSVALEYAQAGIRVNAVCPGVIDTAMVDRLGEAGPEVIAALTASQPIGRLGRASEVAAAVVWLCSDAASLVTGHALAVDGGYLAR